MSQVNVLVADGHTDGRMSFNVPAAGTKVGREEHTPEGLSYLKDSLECLLSVALLYEF